MYPSHSSYWDIRQNRSVRIASPVGQAQFMLTDYTRMIEPRPNEWLLLCRFADTIGIEHGERELRELRHLTDERFAKLSATYEVEQAELKQSVESLSAIVEASEAQAVNIKSFLKIVKKYTEPTELTPQLLHEFVDKIVVHEADKSSGHRIQRIDVHYNFIGEIDFSPEYCG